MDTAHQENIRNPSPVSFSTRGLSPAEQAEAAVAYESEFAHIVPANDDSAHGFHMEDRMAVLGSMLVATRRVAASSYIRSASEIRRNPIDHFCFLVYRRGKISLLEDIPSGKVFTHDHGQPWEGLHTDADISFIVLPRDSLGRASALAEPLNARSVPGPLAGLLADHIISLTHRMSEFTPADAPHMVAATQAMIAACLAPTRDALMEAQRPIAQVLVQRVKRYVEDHLHDSSLSADQIGRHFGMSRRQVYRLFEPFGGVDRFIKRRRLAHAHARLADLSEVLRIKEIGYEAGFSSAAEFSRSFRQIYGYSPREVREAIATRPHPQSLRAHTDRGVLYSDLLRQIH
ncbi:helix-turn-helix domain-containing protein [Inquilinus limosus]|uniref:HTH araC/xylS-type domain-containing protein n=1 Tax=Inquilinus limosus TaxID=171674 RepID=A0A211ZU04_9PROT|nr:helix-turn-helix domain-containing protein [Inquilinus limosus]OWJ68745.1 hypothetical protein BWR60_03085 [Inquilinus limosus]